MNAPSSQTALSVIALLIMGALSGALVFHAVPPDNQQLVTFALGAISGALTVGGATRSASASTKTGDVNVAPTPEVKP